MDVVDQIPGALPFVGREKADSEPFLERAARWASRLTYRDVPKPVRRSAKAQVTSTVGAALWARSRPIGDRIGSTVETRSGNGVVTCLSDVRTTPGNAAYGNAALASALEFDGAILGGYVGRSSVFVPLAYAESEGASGRRLLVAQIAANEVAGRLGAATAIGPFAEERAAYVHAVGAVVGRGVIEDEDAEVLTDALATALSQPPWPLERSTVGSEAGVWSASESIRIGVAAVDSARSAIEGRRDLIEGEDGLFSTVSTRPRPEYLSGLGERWHTRTASVKQFPAGEFVAAPIEAALEVRSRFDRGRTAVNRVDVYVPNAAIEAASRAEAYEEGRNSSPSRTALARSISHNVAAALVDGERTPAMDRKGSDVRTIAERVRVHHDPELTVAAARSAGQSGVTLGGAGRAAPFRAARTLGPKATLRHLPTVLRAGRVPPSSTLEDANRRFGARVVATTSDGRTREATVERPAGFAGAPLAERRAVARTKCRRAMEALGVDAAAARRRTERLLAIDEWETVSLEPVLESVEERNGK